MCANGNMRKKAREAMRRSVFSVGTAASFYLLLLKARIAPMLTGTLLLLVSCCLGMFCCRDPFRGSQIDGNVWFLVTEIMRGVPEQASSNDVIAISPEWLILQMSGIATISMVVKCTSADYEGLLVATVDDVRSYSIAEILWVLTMVVLRYCAGFVFIISAFVASRLQDGFVALEQVEEFLSVEGLFQICFWPIVPILLAIGMGVAQLAIQSSFGPIAGIASSGLFCIASSVLPSRVFFADISMYARFDGSAAQMQEDVLIAFVFLLVSGAVFLIVQNQKDRL